MKAEEIIMILIDLLGVFTDLTPDIIDIYIDLFGIPCDIYSPLSTSDSLYDDHGIIKYAKTPTRLQEKVLIVNFIRNNSMRGNLTQFDSFLDENRPYIITHEQKRIEPRSKIEAHFLGAKMSFQTEIDNVINGVLPEGGNHSTIMVKQYLRPMTGNK